MGGDPILQLLTGQWPDPETGHPLGVPVRSIVIAESLSEIEAMRRLARMLMLSGLGMCLCGGSYPASQGEHLISHNIEMMGGPDLPASFHGEQRDHAEHGAPAGAAARRGAGGAADRRRCRRSGRSLRRRDRRRLRPRAGGPPDI